MAYSDIYLKPSSKPPTVLIVLALIAVGGFLATFLRGNAPTSMASKQTLIYHSVVNLSARQAGVYYQTTNPTKSWVLFGKDADKLDRSGFDDRDTENQKIATSLHYIPLNDLEANTTYYYKIIADDEVISLNNSDTFSFKTATPSTTAASTAPAYGKVIESNSEAVNNAFVIYYYPNAYPLVTAVKGGDWLIALNILVDRKTGKTLTIDKTQTVKIEMISEDLKSTTIETALENTTPLAKTVILGNPYSAEDENAVLSANTSVSVAPKIISQLTTKPTVKPTATPTKVTDEPIEISFPKDEAVIPGNNPLIKGLALPGKQVAIGIRKATTRASIYTTKLEPTAKGEWKVSLPMPLLADSYILSMTTLNSKGRSITLTRNFSTTKSGEAVLAAATGEGSLSPTAVVPSPTKVIAQNLTPVPTSGVIATFTPAAVTAIPSPPVTGVNNTLIIIGSVALVIIGAGVLFIL